MGLKGNIHYILGAYVPLTVGGNIVVDGVLAFCYPSSDHDLDHLAMAPIHLFPDFLEMIFGSDGGFSTYVDILDNCG